MTFFPVQRTLVAFADRYCGQSTNIFTFQMNLLEENLQCMEPQ